MSDTLALLSQFILHSRLGITTTHTFRLKHFYQYIINLHPEDDYSPPVFTQIPSYSDYGLFNKLTTVYSQPNSSPWLSLHFEAIQKRTSKILISQTWCLNASPFGPSTTSNCQAAWFCEQLLRALSRQSIYVDYISSVRKNEMLIDYKIRISSKESYCRPLEDDCNTVWAIRCNSFGFVIQLKCVTQFNQLNIYSIQGQKPKQKHYKNPSQETVEDSDVYEIISVNENQGKESLFEVHLEEIQMESSVECSFNKKNRLKQVQSEMEENQFQILENFSSLADSVEDILMSIQELDAFQQYFN